LSFCYDLLRPLSGTSVYWCSILMALALPTQQFAGPPSNKELLSSARESLAHITVALARLEHVHAVSDTLISQIKVLSGVESSMLPEHLNKTLASAQFVPPPEIAEVIRARALQNLQQALGTLLISTMPDVQSVQEHLTCASLHAADTSSAHIAGAIAHGKELHHRLTDLSSESQSLDQGADCAAELKKFVQLSRQFSNKIGLGNLATVAKEFSKQLDAYDSNLHETRRTAQAELLPPPDSEMYRNILLAIDLYELERNPNKKDPTQHILHNDNQVEGINAIYRSLPAAHSIDTQSLSAALTTVLGDKVLADTIAHTFIEKAVWYQLEYPLVQSMLQVSPDQMDLLLKCWSFSALREFAQAGSSLKMPAKVLSQTLLKDTTLLTEPERALNLLSDIATYTSELSPLERYLPRISPHTTPELFMRQDSLQVAQSWLARARDGSIGQPALTRIAAENALSKLLGPFLEHAKSAASTLVYGFGKYAEPREAVPSPITLAQVLVTRNKDLLKFDINQLGSQTGLDLERGKACSELEQRGLFRIEAPPHAKRKISHSTLTEMETKLADNTQRALPPAIWEHTLAILDALHQPPVTMHKLLNQIDALLETHAPKATVKDTAERRLTLAASSDEVHSLISDIFDQLDRLKSESKPHELKKNIDRLTTSCTKLKKLLCSTTSPLDPALEDLLEQMRIPPRVSTAEVDNRRTTARQALTAISNLLIEPSRGIKS
jgi:hypothetical protein